MHSSYVFEHLINAQINIAEQQQQQSQSHLQKPKQDKFQQSKEKSLKFCNRLKQAFSEVGNINKAKKNLKN